MGQRQDHWLGLVGQELDRRKTETQKVLVIPTDPWRYDPTTGAKESLIAEVLAALASEIDTSETQTDKAQNLLARLGKLIDWAKAIKLAATSSLTLQIPDFDKLVELVKPKDGDEESVRGLEEFRDEFAQLIGSEDLKHISAVVVLVDDLDRCLPETVVESLEAMRLFLAVPKMSFVIAADEDRVADAIRTRFKSTGRPEESDDHQQDPATLYLHKIVQTTIPLPALSHFDTQAYLLLLQLEATTGKHQLATLIDAAPKCAARAAPSMTSARSPASQWTTSWRSPPVSHHCSTRSSGAIRATSSASSTTSTFASPSPRVAASSCGPICINGVTSGADCGLTVFDTNINHVCDDGDVLRNGDGANSTSQADCSQPGDSGGSIVYDHSGAETQEGIASGHQNFSIGCAQYFTGIEETIQAWGGNVKFH